MKSQQLDRGFFLILGLSVFLAGCGKSNEKATFPVKGVVKFEGKPLEFGSVVFVPKGGGPTAQANIAPDGSYELGSYSLTDGAVPGTHQVMILADKPAGTGAGALPEDVIKKPTGGNVSVIPEKFADLTNSGLEVTVKSQPNTVNFALSKKSGEVQVVDSAP
ncbi:MAG TPA: hypothetical protein VM510_13330 [Caulifigura sp.]|jgi:hypothetical protein|nr:hypothetical protein [Caulifigura sp.]